MSVEIVGPFKERWLVIDGWRVPLLSAVEQDGGKMFLTVDHRMAVEVDAKDFEQIAHFIADVIATCWGYGAHPNSDEYLAEHGLSNPFEDQRAAFARVPHPSLAPHRVSEITGVDSSGEGER